MVAFGPLPELLPLHGQEGSGTGHSVAELAVCPEPCRREASRDHTLLLFRRIQQFVVREVVQRKLAKVVISQPEIA